MVFYEGAVKREELYNMPLLEVFELLEDAEDIQRARQKELNNA